MARFAFGLVVIVLEVGCVSVRPPPPWLDTSHSAPARTPGVGGCMSQWDARQVETRSRVLGQVEAIARNASSVWLMEVGCYGANGCYGYALVVDGVAIRGLRSRWPNRRADLEARERATLDAAAARVGRPMKSGYDVATDGECFYVTGYHAGSVMQFGRAGGYVPPANPSFEPADQEEAIIAVLQEYADDP